MGSIYHGWIGNSCCIERDYAKIERFDPNVDKEEEFFQWKVGWSLICEHIEECFAKKKE